MEKRKNPSLYRLVTRMIDGFLKTTKDLSALAQAEARLAIKSFINIAILSVLLRTLLITTWLSICAGFALYLAILQNNWMLSFAEMAVLNFILMIIVGVYILKLKNNFSFSGTRRQLDFSNIQSEADHVDNAIKE